MGIMVDELETGLEDIEEEVGLILKEWFMILIFQGIMDELPPFEKYWTHMLQNKSMPVMVSVIVSFYRSLDWSMRSSLYRETQKKRHLPWLGRLRLQQIRCCFPRSRMKQIRGAASVKCWRQIVLGQYIQCWPCGWLVQNDSQWYQWKIFWRNDRPAPILW